MENEKITKITKEQLKAIDKNIDRFTDISAWTFGDEKTEQEQAMKLFGLIEGDK
jgi:hypothetical protein